MKSGQMGTGMAAMLAGFGPRGMAMYADWTDRIAAGEVPEAPPRPQGVERNVVVSLWDWSNDRGICPRHDFDRQAQSDPQRQRSRLQHFEVQRARCEHPRPEAPYGNGCDGADSRHGHGVHQPAEEHGAVTLLGRGDHLVGPGQPAQPDAGSHGAGLAHACDSCDRQSGVVQTGIEPSIRPERSLSTPAAAISP